MFKIIGTAKDVVDAWKEQNRKPKAAGRNKAKSQQAVAHALGWKQREYRKS